MKRFLIFLAILFLGFSSASFAKLNVVTTIPTFAALAQEVGKDLIDVKSIARGDQDPHFLEAKPSYAMTLNRADLLIENGLELEEGWLPVLLVQSRNPKIQPGQKGYLNASEGIPLLELPNGKLNRSEGDVHPLGNPHYWLNPRNGLIIARHIADRLKELDPANATQYDQNENLFEQNLNNRIAGWEKKLSPLKGKQIITYHKSFSYFSDWSGITVAGYVEPKPGIPPNPDHLISLIDLIQRNQIRLIVSENYYDPKSTQQLAQKSGAKFVTVATSVDGDPLVKNYSDLFENLIRNLEGNL